MNVYAQATDTNQRLCSLLSSVLNRSIRDDFVDAIHKKADLLSSARRQTNVDDHPLPCRVGLIFVGPLSAVEALAQQSSRFSNGYDFDVLSIPLQANESSPARSIQQTLQALERTVHICQRSNNRQRTVLVAVASGVDIVYPFLASQRYDSAIIGVVSIDPPHHDAVPFLPSCIPILVLLSKSEDRLSLDDRQLFRMNASVIMVYSNQKDVESIKWDYLEKAAGQSVDDHRFWSDPIWLWIVRSIAKFAEAAARLDDDDDSASRNEQHSEKEPPSLTVELISKL